jgi:hypothetical protein
MSVRLGHETKGFAQAIQAELHQARSGLKWWMKRHYLEVGFYYRHLQGYYARFDGRQIRIYLYDDLKADPQHLLQEIFRFLGVDESFVPDFSVKHLVSGIPKNKAGGFVIGLLERLPLKDALRRVIPDRVRHRLMYAVESRLVTEPPSLDPEIRADLIEIFRDDLRRLQDLIQRDLSHWMT